MAHAPGWLASGAAAALRTRRLVRAPIGLYRRGLGWLLGERMLMLGHRGRTSGLVRRVVLEVIGNPRPGRYLIVSGFGERFDWLRNVRAEPRVRVSVGRRRSATGTAHELSRTEASEALASYLATHPLAWAVLSSTMTERLGTDLASLPIVALDLDG